MNIKASVAMAVLAMSTIGVSACGSSSFGAAANPATSAGSASASTAPSAAPSATAPAAGLSSSSSTASTGTPTQTASSTGSSGGASGRTDIPLTAMLAQSDLTPSPSGSWQQHDGAVSPGIQTIDPDNCDPTPRPQALDPKYPHNPAWVNARTLGWSSADSAAQINETVITYTSAATASADFTKHQGWTASCASNFQWTDAPMKFTISPASLTGVSGSYAIRVAMDPTDQSSSTPGSLGVDYMAVMLRGNTLTVLSVSNTGAAQDKPKDPGLSMLQHNVQIAATKLSAVYTSTR